MAESAEREGEAGLRRPGGRIPDRELHVQPEEHGGSAVRELARGHAVRVHVVLRPADDASDGASGAVVQPAAGGEVRAHGWTAYGPDGGHEPGWSGDGSGVAERVPGAGVRGDRLAPGSGMGVRGHGCARRRGGSGCGRPAGSRDPGRSWGQALARSWTRVRALRCARRERGGAAVGGCRAVGKCGSERRAARSPPGPGHRGVRVGAAQPRRSRCEDEEARSPPGGRSCAGREAARLGAAAVAHRGLGSCARGYPCPCLRSSWRWRKRG